MALDFVAASSQYISIGDSASLEIREAISIVVKMETHTIAAGIGHWVSKFDVGLTEPYVFRRNGDELEFGFYDGVTYRKLITTTANLATNTKYCVIATYDRAFIRIYKNDAEVDNTNAYNQILPRNNNPLVIAIRGEDFVQAFDGVIYEARIYNRTLSLAEVKAIYYTQGVDNIVNGLVARWLMNEKPDGTAAAGANTVIDISKNRNRGTPVNSPVYRAASMKLVRPVIVSGIGA